MKTILIVDDEPAARYGLRRALESKYRIAEADSAEAAREALPREQPDLVLLDVVLPGQNGISFLQWMRDQGNQVPVLMVSALDAAKTLRYDSVVKFLAGKGAKSGGPVRREAPAARHGVLRDGDGAVRRG